MTFVFNAAGEKEVHFTTLYNYTDFLVKYALVGSRITCNPPPTDTDLDVLLLIKPKEFWNAIECLQDEGFELGGSDLVPAEESFPTEWEGFQSYKKGDINYIITTSEEFFDKFMLATNIAKELNLLKKEDRIALFQRVLYGVDRYNYNTLNESIEKVRTAIGEFTKAVETASRN